MATTKKSQSVREQLIANKNQRFGKHPIEIEGVDAKLFVRELSAKAVAEITDRLSPEQVEAAEKAADGDTASLNGASRSGFDTLSPWIIAALVDEDVKPVFREGDEDLVLEVFSMRQAREIMEAVLSVNQMREDPEGEKND